MRRSSGLAVVTFVAALALILEALAITAGSGVLIGLVVVAGVAFVLTLSRFSLRKLGVGAALAAATILPWNGIKFGLRLGDAVLLLALLLLVIAEARNPLPRLPAWVIQLGAVILLVAMLDTFVRIDQHYIASRLIIGANGQPVPQTQTDLGVAVKYLIAVVAVPIVFALASLRDRRVPRWLLTAFTAGVSFSGLVAFSDRLGLTHLGLQLTHISFGVSRQNGLSLHPNFLAGGCVLAAAFPIWMATHSRPRVRRLGYALLPGIVAGIYATGSRGGSVAFVLAVALSVLVLPRLRRHLPTIFLGALALVLVVFALVPALGQAVLRAARLSGGGASNVSGSNLARSLSAQQGWEDLRHSPVYGVGLQVAAEAQSVYIQELASGGILLFAAMTVYTLGALRASTRLRHLNQLGYPFIVMIIANAAFNVVEASLTDRFTYVTFGVLAAMVATRCLADDPENEKAASDPVVDEPIVDPRAPDPPLPADALDEPVPRALDAVGPASAVPWAGQSVGPGTA